jgi:fatty-acyl-CoA synthase
MPLSRDLGSLLREQAARFGTHPALIGMDETLGYTALAERAARIATFLAARGVQRGDRIGLLMNNRPEWVETLFGAAMAGAVVVAFSTWSKRDELA